MFRKTIPKFSTNNVPNNVFRLYFQNVRTSWFADRCVDYVFSHIKSPHAESITLSPLRTPLSHFGTSPKNDCNDGGSHFAKLQDPMLKFMGSTMWCFGIRNTPETCSEIDWMDLRWQMNWIPVLCYALVLAADHTHIHASHHILFQVYTFLVDEYRGNCTVKTQ